MASVTIYSTNYCPYCTRAKELLKTKGQAYTEINVEEDAAREAMIVKAGGRRSVPQIFINDIHVGGFDDLHALDKEGKLEAMLRAD